MNPSLEAFGSPDDTTIEECAEVIQAIIKAKRFGYRNFHPNTPKICNAELILNEIDDLQRRINEFTPLLKCSVIRFKSDHKIKD